MSNNRKKLFEILLVIFIFIVAIGFGVYFVFSQKDVTIVKRSTYDSSKEDKSKSKSDTNEENFEISKDIETILFMGIDTRVKPMIDTQPGYNGQADCIFLLILNKKTEETTILEISRETMVDVDVYDSTGSFLQSCNAQLCLQYAYGDGNTKSSWLMKNKVSSLLHNIPINYTLALNLDGLVKLVDALGGLQITIPKDYTNIEHEFIEGELITLDGRLSERYVRYRDITVSGSNEDRMERQKQFIPLLVAKAKNIISTDSDEFNRLYNIIEPYITTDLSMDSINGLIKYNLSEKIEKLPGKVKEGSMHDEFYVDEETLLEVLKTVIPD